MMMRSHPLIPGISLSTRCAGTLLLAALLSGVVVRIRRGRLEYRAIDQTAWCQIGHHEIGEKEIGNGAIATRG
jgi:hypothetical protein